MDSDVAKGVQTQPAPFPASLAQFTAGLDPFKAMMVKNVAVAKHLRHRQGRGGAIMTTLPLSLLWICENDMVLRVQKRNYFAT